MDAMHEFKIERVARQRLRRANILNWLLCALNEAGAGVEDLRISSEPFYEWVEIDLGRGIVRRNVTEQSDVDMMITILSFLKTYKGGYDV